jgi:hypothetical protein
LNHNALPLSVSTHIRVIRDGEEREVAIAELRQLLAVDALIRLQEAEFQFLPSNQSTYTHFNLERTTNAVGKRYAIVPIVKSGRRLDNGTELLPVVDVAPARTGICLEVQQRVPIAEVARRYFDHSLPHIKTPDQLQDVLLARYRSMYPCLMDEAIISRGCAISLIDLDSPPTAIG